MFRRDGTPKSNRWNRLNFLRSLVEFDIQAYQRGPFDGGGPE